MPDAPGPWDVLIPVKRFGTGKTRLAGLGEAVRASLARAMALDTISAACAARQVGRVVLVTDEPVLGAYARRHGLVVVPDEGAGDLNQAVAVAAGELSLDPGTVGTAVLLADLPELLSGDLDAALGAAVGHPTAFVEDSRGTGTTLLTASRGSRLQPRFGPGSADRHRAAGAVAIGAPLPTLRRDVDVLEDLQLLGALPPGRHTGAWLAQHRSSRATAQELVRTGTG